MTIFSYSCCCCFLRFSRACDFPSRQLLVFGESLDFLRVCLSAVDFRIFERSIRRRFAYTRDSAANFVGDAQQRVCTINNVAAINTFALSHGAIAISPQRHVPPCITAPIKPDYSPKRDSHSVFVSNRSRITADVFHPFLSLSLSVLKLYPSHHAYSIGVYKHSRTTTSRACIETIALEGTIISLKRPLCISLTLLNGCLAPLPLNSFSCIRGVCVCVHFALARIKCSAPRN